MALAWEESFRGVARGGLFPGALAYEEFFRGVGRGAFCAGWLAAEELSVCAVRGGCCVKLSEDAASKIAVRRSIRRMMFFLSTRSFKFQISESKAKPKTFGRHAKVRMKAPTK